MHSVPIPPMDVNRRARTPGPGAYYGPGQSDRVGASEVVSAASALLDEMAGRVRVNIPAAARLREANLLCEHCGRTIRALIVGDPSDLAGIFSAIRFYSAGCLCNLPSYVLSGLLTGHPDAIEVYQEFRLRWYLDMGHSEIVARGMSSNAGLCLSERHKDEIERILMFRIEQRIELRGGFRGGRD